MEFPILTAVPPEVVTELLSVARRRTFRRGEVVFHAEDPADALHLVRSGRLCARLVNAYGDSTMLSVIGPGDVIGELALLDGEPNPRSATVEALEQSETLCITASAFRRLRRSQPGVTDALVAVLADRVRRLSRALLVAHYLDAESRVRVAVLDLAEAYRTSDGPTDIPLRQDQIAELAGVARATVNRVLHEEEAHQTVELARGLVRVLDPPSIKRRIKGLR